MSKDPMGDRMKAYEAVTDIRLDPTLPIVVRIDGRSFSTYTRGCKKPFDSRVTDAMQAATAKLVEESHALIGYTQSDEITLIFQGVDGGSCFFDGRVLKLASVLASIAAVAFDRAYGGDKMPSFDCRVFQVPTQTEAANALLWRVFDAIKNSVSSVAQANFSSKELYKKSRTDMVSMLDTIGIDFFKDFTSEQREGTFLRRCNVYKQIPDEIWNKIPQNNKPESRFAVRSEVQKIAMPYFGIVLNREWVIFNKEDPIDTGMVWKAVGGNNKLVENSGT